MSWKLGLAGILLFLLVPTMAEVDTTRSKPYRASQGHSDLGRSLMCKLKHPPFDDAIERSKAIRVREMIEGEPSDLYYDKIARSRGTQANHTPGTTSAHAGARGMTAAIEDFLVNDDFTGSAEHYSPGIARAPDGRFVVAWMDGQSGTFDIYVQRFDSSGIPQGPAFKVDDSPGWVWHGYPAVAMRASGSFVVTWDDDRNGPYSDIYVQRYDSAANPLGNNFKVNDDMGSAHQHYPEIAMDGAGNFVITWEDGRGDPTEIYAQRYDSLGNPVGPNFEVSEVAGYYNHYNPDVAMSHRGNSVIVWESGDIYAQMYDSTGGAVGTNFQVNEEVGSSFVQFARVAMNGPGRFVVTWIDNRAGTPRTYGQQYDSGGNPLGPNFQVTDGANETWLPNPDITMDDSGQFVIAWTDSRGGDYDIYAQRYDSGGAPQGLNFKVNDDAESDYQWEPAIAADGFGSFVVTWEDYRHGSSHIFVQRYDCSGGTLDFNFRVDSDVGTANQSTPQMAASESGRFVICWTDYRNGNSDIYGQRYDTTGAAAGPNFGVNDDAGTFSQYFCAVATDACGDFVAAWTDGRNGDEDVYAQRYYHDGSPMGPNFRVNDDAGTESQRSPTIGMNALGRFIITWGDRRNGPLDIYAQQYDSAGTPAGDNFQVDDGPEHSWQMAPAIAVQNSGAFVITWYDDRNGDLDIYAQRYLFSGTPLGPNFRVNDDAGTSEQTLPDVALAASGRFTIVWSDYRNGDRDIYAQRYDSLGASLGSNFRVNDDAGVDDQHRPAIAMDPSGGFVVTWQDRRNGWPDPDVYAQRYDSLGNPLYGNFPVADPSYASYAQISPDIAGNGSNIYFTWTDNRRAKGWDIYANVRYCHPPNAFSLLYPPNKTYTPRMVYLDWEDACDPEWCDFIGYDLYLSTSSHFPPSSTIVDENIPTSEHRRTLDYGHYYWNVKAKDYCGAETWSSDVRHFVVTGIPCSRGDFNSDGSVDLGDVIFALNYLFKSGPAPYPLELGDVNCDGLVDLGDVVYLISYLFKGGPAPCSW